MKLYLETSALLRATLQQQREVIDRMRDVESWVTCTLTLVECERTLVMLQHTKKISRPRAARAHAYLREVVWRTDVNEVDADLLERAGQAFSIEPVRSLDAIHLASIIRWSTVGPVEVLTSDKRVNDNAAALGLTVWYYPVEPSTA
jgi:predicted nucleic acid-binding protein